MIGAAVPKGVFAAALTAALWTSCASPQGVGGPKADCFRIEDCQEGLVCIEKKCSRDLAKIMGENPPMAGGGQGGMAPAGDGAANDAGGPAPGDGAPSGGAPGSGGAAPANGGATPASGGAPAGSGGAGPADAGPG